MCVYGYAYGSRSSFTTLYHSLSGKEPEREKRKERSAKRLGDLFLLDLPLRAKVPFLPCRRYQKPLPAVHLPSDL